MEKYANEATSQPGLTYLFFFDQKEEEEDDERGRTLSTGWPRSFVYPWEATSSSVAVESEENPPSTLTTVCTFGPW